MQTFRHKASDVRKRRGSIVLLAAFCLVIVIAFLAFSIDFGYIVVAESDLQTAADAGALSGARALRYENYDEVVAAAQTWAGKNVVAGENVTMVASEDVELGKWDKDTATFTVLPVGSTQSPNAVRVTCRRTASRGNALTLFFAPVLGVNQADLVVTSIAIREGGTCGGIMAMNRVYLREDSYTDSYDSTAGNYSSGSAGANGDVCTNGHVRLLHNAGINGDAHYGPDEDGVDMSSTNYVTGDQVQLDELIDFPPVNVGNTATVNDNFQIPETASGEQFDGDGDLEIDDGDSLALPPGTYYFSKLTLTGGATITVSGPTYIYTTDEVDLSDGGIINETLVPMNLQIYPLGTKFLLPDDVDLHAVIYSTTSAIEKDGGGSGGGGKKCKKGSTSSTTTGSGEFFGKMVGQKIKINGSGGLHVDESAFFGDLESGGEQLGTSTVTLVY